MAEGAWQQDLLVHLPHHARVIQRLSDAVLSDERLRWFEVVCSLGSSRGDEHSDIDSAVGYAEPLADEEY